MTEIESLEKFGTVLFSKNIMMRTIIFNGSEMDLGPWLALFSFYEEPKCLAILLRAACHEFLESFCSPVQANHNSKNIFIQTFIELFRKAPHRFDLIKNEVRNCRTIKEI